MPIQILSPQLANQIAAGEVVERPASVIKELAENSLDAEANSIEIEIDKGGHKRISIRDNGKGIPQQELELALSRHATSKISKLDDLENICSLGFRGEALASISSVSRLTLTSKPKDQQQAWQACAEGREMQVNVQPAAHPNGTSIEVLDLFFNTPARRKFLRAEKTEFSHIDEVIRRIALSRFDVAITLKHNAKTVRKYPAIKDSQSHIKRIAAVCGSDFANSAISIDSEYEGIKLTGWLSAAGASRQQNDLQYVYVNGRVMKDKLINHAIKQAYEGLIEPNSHPAFVLFLRLDPMQVDVNVHPAKHEVRFHQSRLVHDVIFRSVSKALTESFSNNASSDKQFQTTHLEEVAPSHQYIRPLRTTTDSATQNQPQQRAPQVYQGAATGKPKTFNYSAPTHSKSGAQHYASLMTPKDAQQAEHNGLGFIQVAENKLLIKHAGAFYVCNSEKLAAKKLQTEAQFTQTIMQPLLMPISFSLNQIELKVDTGLIQSIKQLGVDLAVVNQRILLKQVPSGTRALDWTSILMDFFDVLVADSKQLANAAPLKSDMDNEQKNQTLADIFYPVLAQHQIGSFSAQNTGLSYLFDWLNKQHEIDDILNACGKLIPLQGWLSQFDE